MCFDIHCQETKNVINPKKKRLEGQLKYSSKIWWFFTFFFFFFLYIGGVWFDLINNGGNCLMVKGEQWIERWWDILFDIFWVNMWCASKLGLTSTESVSVSGRNRRFGGSDLYESNLNRILSDSKVVSVQFQFGSSGSGSIFIFKKKLPWWAIMSSS